MPILALFLFTFVSFTTNAEIIIEPRSILLKNRGFIRAHNQAIYENKETGLHHRNRMFPRILRKAIEKSSSSVGVVVANEKAIDWFKMTTPILEYVPEQLLGVTEVNWLTRDQALGDSVSEYWIVPFGNPLKTVDDAKEEDLEWAYQTIESSLERYHALKAKGYNVSFVLDLSYSAKGTPFVDGGETAQLALWSLNQINTRLYDSEAQTIPVQVIRLENSFAKMRTQELEELKMMSVDELSAPYILEHKHPEIAKKFKALFYNQTQKMISSPNCTRALRL